jgi:hypothetical protein
LVCICALLLLVCSPLSLMWTGLTVQKTGDEQGDMQSSLVLT